jgi:isopropylmalate/homocitrate/citramalate synthase
MTRHPDVYVSDCTLRDARQAPGVYISPEEGASIAGRLVDLGVDEVEAGVATGQLAEAEFIRRVRSAVGRRSAVSAVYFCLGTGTIPDALSFVQDCGCDTVCVSIPTSQAFIWAKLRRSFRATCALMARAVSAAAGRGLRVAFSGEDAARADPVDLAEYVRIGAESGATRFRFAESVACLEPDQIRVRIADLVAAARIPVEIHCHSAYGLAMANTVAALTAGARWASVTVDGIGERGGNTPLGPVLLYLYRFRGQTRFRLGGLKSLSDYIAGVTRLGFHRFTPIVGESAFQYEISKQYESYPIYEDYPPELVGGARELVLGLKADPKAIELVAARYGLDPEAAADLVAAAVRTTRRPVRLVDVPTLFSEERTDGGRRTV